MKMIAGGAARASLNRSRTREAPTPTIISINSDVRWSRSFGQFEGFVKVYSSCEIMPSSPAPAGDGQGRDRAGCD